MDLELIEREEFRKYTIELDTSKQKTFDEREKHISNIKRSVKKRVKIEAVKKARGL